MKTGYCSDSGDDILLFFFADYACHVFPSKLVTYSASWKHVGSMHLDWMICGTTWKEDTTCGMMMIMWAIESRLMPPHRMPKHSCEEFGPCLDQFTTDGPQEAMTAMCSTNWGSKRSCLFFLILLEQTSGLRCLMHTQPTKVPMNIKQSCGPQQDVSTQQFNTSHTYADIFYICWFLDVFGRLGKKESYKSCCHQRHHSSITNDLEQCSPSSVQFHSSSLQGAPSTRAHRAAIYGWPSSSSSANQRALLYCPMASHIAGKLRN